MDDFWILISRFKVFERISEKTFAKAIEDTATSLDHILQQQNVVSFFGQTIANHIITSIHDTELLISYYLRDGGSTKLYFPSELDDEQKEKALLNYIRADSANPNYLHLIAESQTSRNLPLKDRIKLEARKKYQEAIDKLFAENKGIAYEISVTFAKDQPEVVMWEKVDSDNLSVIYDINWVKENRDYATLLNNFIYLFGYVDRVCRSKFPSLSEDMSIIERHVGVGGKRQYRFGLFFQVMHGLFNSQLKGYCRQLTILGIRIELIFKWFFETYLSEEFQVSGFSFHAPSDNTTDLEKCKLMASEIDSILKQFALFVTEDCIDRQLFEMSSAPKKISDIPSLHKNKYVYALGDACTRNMFLLFSDQSGLAFNLKTKAKYRSFYWLLKSEDMEMEDFHAYQTSSIHYLLDNGCIHIQESGVLILDTKKTAVLKDLFYNEVLCLLYWDPHRAILDGLMNTGDIKYESSLFSRPEQNYINYILNKAEYSNGYDLRNKYVHGTYPLLADDHERDYIELLKIMVLVIIKINEEFCFLQNTFINMSNQDN